MGLLARRRLWLVYSVYNGDFWSESSYGFLCAESEKGKESLIDPRLNISDTQIRMKFRCWNVLAVQRAKVQPLILSRKGEL